MNTPIASAPPLTRHQLGMLVQLLDRARRSFADPEARRQLQAAFQVADDAFAETSKHQLQDRR